MFGRCAFYTLGVRYFYSTSFSWTFRWRALRAGDCNITNTYADMCNGTTTMPFICGSDLNSVIYRSAPNTADINAGLTWTPGGVYPYYLVFVAVGSVGTFNSYRDIYFAISGCSVLKIWSPGTNIQEVENQNKVWYPGNNNPGATYFIPNYAQFTWLLNCTAVFYNWKVNSNGYLLKSYSANAPITDNGTLTYLHYGHQLKTAELAVTSNLINDRTGRLGNNKAWGNIITPCHNVC